MNRAAVSVFLIVALALGSVACGDHEAEPTTTTFDFTPTATISVGDDGINCLTVATDAGCEVESGAVLSVENSDEVNHRLIGTNDKGGNAFDTGVMQPEDETTIVLTADGIVTVTDELWPDGESPTIDITVAPADD